MSQHRANASNPGRRSVFKPVRGHHSRLHVEALEERTLLSLTEISASAEFRVNTFTTNAQVTPAVATDAAGDYVVAWASNLQDGSGYGIYAQRSNRAGVAQGGEFKVNTYTTGNQQRPTVAMDAAGDFVVAWESNGQDGSGYGVYAQRYNAAGVAQGTEFRVSSVTINDQGRPQVAMDAVGNFVVIFQSDGADGNGFGVAQQRFNAAGVAQGSSLFVNNFTTGNQSFPSVAMDAAGDFVVAWQSANEDGSGNGVYARRLNNAGLAIGNEFQVNTYTTGNQGLPRVAVDGSGDFVIGWESYGQDGSGYGIYAQRYNPSGVVQGGEFQVNTYTTGNQGLSQVAMDGSADFVVTWESNGQDGSGYGIYARRYFNSGTTQAGEFQVNSITVGPQGTSSVTMDSSGDFVIAWESNNSIQDVSSYGIYAKRYSLITAMPVVKPAGAEFRVNTYTTSTQGFSDVASDAAGDYVVAWESQAQDGSGYGIYAQRYSRSGVAQGSEFKVNTYTTGDQINPTVAMDAAGDFVVAWESSGRGIYAQRYNAAGVAQGGEFQVNQITATTNNPSLAMDAAGDFVVVWQGFFTSLYEIEERRFNNAGVAQGGEFRVNTYTTGEQTSPSVAMDAGGDFVVAWQSYAQDGSGYGIYAQRVDSAGFAEGSEFQVNTYTTNKQELSSVAMDAAGDFVVAWQSMLQDGSGYGIYAQRYNAAAVAEGSEFKVNTYMTNSQIQPSLAMDAAGDFVVAWGSSGQDGSLYGVYAQRYNASGTAQGTEFQVNTYTTGSQVGRSMAMDAAGDFVVSWGSNGQDGSSYGIYAQRYSSEFRVNTYTTSAQINPAVASDAAGDYVVAWESNQDGGGYGIYAQRYSSSGMAQGGEFRVNTYTTGNQVSPAVAMDSAGDFVITWASYVQDGSLWGVYAQRYNASGVAQGGEFRINSHTTSTQQFPSVGMDGTGDFVVAWESALQDGSGYGIYAQRYNSAGVTQGSEFKVNTFTTGNQAMPAVAVDAAGDFIVAWESAGQDGSLYGIYAQRYNSAGVAQGSEFKVNTYTTSNQKLPSIATNTAGDFVVAWESAGQDGSLYGVYAQRYNSAGVAQGGEFKVNTYNTSNQQLPSVAMDAAGDFVVDWQSYVQDGSGWGAYAQRYSAAGIVQGSEFLVNSYTTGNQELPRVAMDSFGDFVVAWESAAQDGAGYGIYAKQYTAPDFPLTATGVNISAAEDQSFAGVVVTFTDADPNAMASDFTATIQWDSNPADTSTGTVSANGQGGFNVTGTNTYTEAGSYPISVTIRDVGTSATAASTATIADVPLSATGVNVSGTEGLPFSGLVATFTDANPNPTLSDFTATIQWDSDPTHTSPGTVSVNGQGGFNVTGANTYAEAGSYPISVTIHDIGGSSATATSTATIADAALSASGVNVSGVEGQLFTGRVATFTDANPNTAAGAGPEFRVNTYAPSNQGRPAVASDAAGDYVIAWDSIQDGGTYGVYAQRYNSSGVAQGSEFQVNTYTTGDQQRPTVAMDAAGDFVVAWESYGQDGSGLGIYAQRYNTGGVAQGSEFQVSTYTTGIQRHPTVAMDMAGEFVVAWESYGQDGSGYGVYAQRYNAAGVAQGSEFRVNTYTTSHQGAPSVATDSSGDFVVAWETGGQDGSGEGIYAQRYNAIGAAQGGEFQVNTYTTSYQFLPSVAMDSAGDFVVAWQSDGQDGSVFGVYAQRYNAAGVAQGSEFRVNTYTTNVQDAPSVAMDSAGDFVVAWQSLFQDGSFYGVYARRYFGSGAPQAGEFQVNTYTAFSQLDPSVAVDSGGDFVVAWDGSSGDISAKRYADTEFTATIQWDSNPAHTSTGTIAVVAGVLTVSGTNTYAEAGSYPIRVTINDPDGSSALATSTATVADAPLSAAGVNVSATEGQSFTGPVATFTDGNPSAPLGDYSATIQWDSNPAHTSAGTISLVAGVLTVSGTNTYAEKGSYPISVAINDTDGNNAAATSTATVADAALSATGVNVSAMEGQSFTGPVATFTDGNPSAPLGDYSATIQWDNNPAHTSAGTISLVSGVLTVSGTNSYAEKGSYPVSVAINDTDGNGANAASTATVADAPLSATGVNVSATEGQPFTGAVATFADANPSAPLGGSGPEFRVNTYTTGRQDASHVASDAAGDYVVTWESYGQDGSGTGIYAQRYNSSGVAQGSEFRVNTAYSGAYPSVAMDSAGDFVVAWGSGGGSFGIYAQRYSAAGVAQGAELQVNTYTASFRGHPSVAMDSAGDFVVAWQSLYQDGSGYGIYAQRYTAAGTAQGNEFRVNTYTTDWQANPSVAMDIAGDFVVTWYSSGQDGPGYSVYAQRYNAAGAAQGSEFRVNTYTGYQWDSSVAMDTAGDFVVAWQSDQLDISGYEIYAQRYSASGAAQGSQFRVNTYTTGDQRRPTVSMDSAGDFVVDWNSIGQDGDLYGVYAQRYGAAGTIQGGEFQVNTFTTGNQSQPSVAMDARGDSVVTWQSYGQDGSDYGIYAKQYRLGDYSATIQWDSNPAHTSAGTIALVSGVLTVSATNSYAEKGSYPISVTIHDVDGSGANAASTATVADAPLSAIGVNVSATEGQSFTGAVATFTDANPSAPLGDYSATIQWDSNPAHASAGTISLMAGVFTVSGTNTYAEKGSYPVSVAINDTDGTNANAASTATVSDAPLSATGVNVSATEGQSFTGPVATFTDGNPSAPLGDYSATIQWDSNPAHTSAGTISLVSGVLTVSGTNTYATHGSYTINVTINDVDGSSAMSSSTATVAAQGSQIAGRRIFYSGSGYDKQTNTALPWTPLPFSDDNAIAADKSAYLPGSGAATFANVSSYVQGINGIMVDLLGSGAHASITASDFVFKSGNTPSVDGTWTTLSGSALPTVSVRLGMTGAANGAGTVSGSDRVELIWASGTAITQKWLEVTVLATANTGLAANDVFFYGSEIGDANKSNTSTIFKVSAVDTTGTQTHLAPVGSNNPITNVFDYNRDGAVSAVDITLDQIHLTTNSTGLVVINIPMGGPFSPPPPVATSAASVTPTASANASVASALVSSSQSPAPPTIPPWIANRLAHLDLNHGPLANYFEHLAHENTAKSRGILGEGERVSDEVGLDEEVIDGLVVGTSFKDT